MSSGQQVYVRNDRLLAALASFATGASTALDAATRDGAKAAMTDTLAVALGALAHPAAVVARRYARHHSVASGATLWGSRLTVTAEAATLANGVPLRGYDYNDLYIGKTGGHPSDMIPGLLALAETHGCSGTALLGAVALGYEVTMHLLDAIDLDSRQWDYPNIIAIGATCAAARLLQLTSAQTAEALAITVIAHFASDEVESGDLNARGDLTMWKRFNGSDAIRQSVYAVLLAQAGAEGAVRPFEGKSGFLSKVVATDADLATLFERLDPARPLARIASTTFKRWPVGSRGQSAIQAALQAREGVADIWKAREVYVTCDNEVYQHLLARRADPWHPSSRETADHSLPYIVTAAVLDGAMGVESFDPKRVCDAALQTFMNEKVKIEPSQALSRGAAGSFLTQVRIVDEAGNVHIGKAAPPPGHADQRFGPADFELKFRENVAPVLGARNAEAILHAVAALDTMQDARTLTSLLAADDVGMRAA